MANDDGVVLAIGDRVGPYRIVGALAPNAYRAVHVTSPRRVVVYIGGATRWRETAIDVLRAARMIDSLAHPGIAPIVDRGVMPDRRPWWASEVPNGMRLYDLIVRRTMATDEAGELVRDLADALAHAHARSFVHGALTLRSIVLATGERKFPLCITDWGMAASADDRGVYTAPEAEVTAAADIYSLGVIAYRATTRRFPADRVIDELPGVAPSLALLIARMLAVDPGERPSASEVRALAKELLAEPANAPREDIVHVSTPRFSKPKWTPAPPITVTSEGADSAAAAGEIVDKN
jgi:serine/threonine-protein kinase